MLINNNQKIPVFFKKNRIFFKNKRIFSSENLENIILNIIGVNNHIYLNPILGSGKLIISLENVNCNTLKFGKNNTVNNNLIITYYNGPGKISKKVSVEIGNKNIFNGNVHIVSPLVQGNSIEIGNQNLFANNIEIKGLSDHKIFDCTTKKQINIEKGIKIKNHNWICDDVLILNRGYISSNCVIAARSLVNKKLDKKNTLYAGQPAIAKKSNINWNISLE